MPGVEMRDDGLYAEVEIQENGKAVDIQVRIADHFLTPARVSDPHSGGGYGLLVEFQDERGRAKRTVIPAADFHGSPRDVCSRLSSLGLFIDRDYQQALLSYLQQEMQSAPSADSVSTPGWITSAVYVLPGEVFGNQENGRPIYYDGDINGYRQKGTLPEWQQQVAAPCIGNSRLIYAISSAFAGPLMLDAGESSGGVHFYAETSKGKTTALIAAGSVCGGGDPLNGCTTSCKITTNGTEPVLAGRNDGGVFFDEIGQANPKDVSDFIYLFSGNIGKGRMTKDLQAAKSHRWRVQIISTGELTLAAHAAKAGVKLPGGAAIRIIDIPADAGAGLGVFEDLHGSESPGEFANNLKAAALTHYGTALPQFLRYLVQLDPSARQLYIREVREQFFSACGLDGNATPEVGRVANRMALIAAAGELAIDFDILPWQQDAAIEGVRKCFDAWRAARGGDDGVGHDAAVAVQQVRGFLERYDIKFENLDRDSDTNRPVIVDRAGWRRKGKKGIEYLIQPEYFKTEVCKGLDPSAVARALWDRGYLHRQGRAWTITTTLPGGGKRRVYCVLESILTEQTEGDA
jgi:putative DNA primase/helicase